MSSDNIQIFIKYFVRIFTIFLILPLHECAHAWTARKFGDDTAYLNGRVTLNPFKHIDVVGALLLVFAGFGWAKPVPINPTNMKNPRLGISITALAGPLSNLIAALVAMIIERFLSCVLPSSSVYSAIIIYFLYYFIIINIGLAVFNLIPVAPLDGEKVVSYFTPYKYKLWMAQHQMYTGIILMIIIVADSQFGGPITRFLGFLENVIYRFFWLITDWIPALFNLF